MKRADDVFVKVCRLLCADWLRSAKAAEVMSRRHTARPSPASPDHPSSPRDIGKLSTTHDSDETSHLHSFSGGVQLYPPITLNMCLLNIIVLDSKKS
jgi:hypothetical protein